MSKRFFTTKGLRSPSSPSVTSTPSTPKFVDNFSVTFDPSLYDDSPGLTLISPGMGSPSVDKEQREEYINHCAELGVEPTLEFLLALSDRQAKSCILSSRRKKLVNEDIICICRALKNNYTLTELDLSNNDFSKAGAMEIAKVFSSNSTLSKLTLNGCSIDDDVLISMAAEIKKNKFSALSHLQLGDNKIGMSSKSAQSVTALTEIVDHNRLKVLDLHKNHLEDSHAAILANALRNNYSLVFINLRSNYIGDKGGAAFGDLLSLNITIKDIDLSSNKIGPEGGARIAHGLRSNSTLQKLNLRSNSVGDYGAKEFAKVFSGNSNNVEELYLGYNFIHVEGALALAEMLKKNIKLKKFDMQGIVLDLGSMKVVSDSLKENKSLVQFVIDVDSSSKDVATTISEVLQTHQTLSDLIIGGGETGTDTVANSRAAKIEQPDEFEEVKKRMKMDENTIADLQDRFYTTSRQLDSQKERTSEMNAIIQEKERALHDKEQEIRWGRERIEELEKRLFSDEKKLESVVNTLDMEKKKNEQHEDYVKNEQQLLTRRIENVLELERERNMQQSRERARAEDMINAEIAKLERHARNRDGELDIVKEDLSVVKQRIIKQGEDLQKLSNDFRSVEGSIIDKVSSKLEDSVKNLFSRYMPTILEGANRANSDIPIIVKTEPPNDSPPLKNSPTRSARQSERGSEYNYTGLERRDPLHPSPSIKSSVNGDSDYREVESMSRDLKYLYDSQAESDDDDSILKDRFPLSRLYNLPLFRSTLTPESPVSDTPLTEPHRNDPRHSLKNSARSSKSREDRGEEQGPRQQPGAITAVDLYGIEERLARQILNLAKEFKLELDNVKFLAKEQNKSLHTSQIGDVSLRESSASMEQLRVELEMKLSNSVRDVEERTDLKISDIDIKVARDVNTIHKLVDERLDQQMKVIGKMTDEQRWIEEEGIKLRVEHEANIQKQVKTVRDEVFDQVRFIEERMKNNLVQFINQHEQGINGIDKTASDAVHRTIVLQEALAAITERVSFLEKHLVLGSSRVLTHSTTSNPSNMSVPTATPMKLQSSFYQQSVPSRDIKSERSTPYHSPPQLDNISISDSVKNLDLTDAADDIRLNVTYPNYLAQKHRKHEYDDEASLKELQALLGRTKQRVESVSQSFSGRASPPTSHFSYDD